MARSLMKHAMEYVSDNAKSKTKLSITHKYYTAPCSGPRQRQESGDWWDILHSKELRYIFTSVFRKGGALYLCNSLGQAIKLPFC